MKKSADSRTGHGGDKKDASLRQNTQSAQETFARIVRAHQKTVFAIAYARLGNAEDAEDVKQEVFVEAWRNLRKIRKPEKIPAWMFKATRNKCRDHFRKKSRRERREGVFVESARSNPANQSPERHEAAEAVFKAVSGLPDKIRTVFMLKHFAGLTYEEISKTTGLSKTTIDGRLRLGKENLRRMLADMGIGVD